MAVSRLRVAGFALASFLVGLDMLTDPPDWLGLTIMLLSILLFLWAIARSQFESVLGRLPGGNWLINKLEYAESIIEEKSNLDEDEQINVRSKFYKLNDGQRNALRRILREGHGRKIPDPLWDPLEDSGLVERNYNNKQGVKKEYRSYIRRLLREQ